MECRQDFNNADELVKHQRNVSACLLLDTPLSPSITAEQIAQLRNRAGKRANISNEEKWRSVYKILFPDRDEPCVACISKASSHLLGDYRKHQVRTLVPLVERELAAISDSHEMSDGLRAHITDLFSRLSVKVLDEFQEKHTASITKECTFPNDPAEKPQNSTYETTTSPSSPITLALSQLQDFLNYDATPNVIPNHYDSLG
ncbi:hypothetical protein RRF57_001417 [Xylaria bambusicola]|uniref:C2H2-type domain-containing protein n=1 Tax=Xylaria bambusicola TaxID=326684 RepID=A0AAN7Z641_9PEZI